MAFDELTQMDVVLDLCTRAVIYIPVVFRSSAIAILFAFGWAVNVYGFDRAGIPFRRVLGLPTGAAQFRDIWDGVKMLSIVLLSCFTLHEFCVHYGLAAGQAVSQVLFWVLLLLLCLASPHPIFRGLRHFVARRTITFVTGAKVEFIDVLTADALTSMSKLLADMQVVVCAIVAVLSMSYGNVSSMCLHSLVAPVLASLPYFIRAVQCYLCYRETGSNHNLVNLGKYLSSFPVIWTSALKHQLAPVEGVSLDRHDQHLQVLWLYTVTLNTMYSFLWDVIMDWGLARSPTAHYPLLRNELLYRNPFYYYAAIVGDLALRLCWSLKLSSHLQHHASGLAFIFLFEVLEVFRRFVWNFFRVEWQCIQDKGHSSTIAAALDAGHGDAKI